MRLLLIDDNLMSSHRLAGALEHLGHACQVIADPATALATALAAATEVDRVVLNLGSRTLDGLAVLRELKATQPDLPVIGFCGHLEVERRRAAKAAGVDRLLTNSDLAQRPEAVVG